MRKSKITITFGGKHPINVKAQNVTSHQATQAVSLMNGYLRDTLIKNEQLQLKPRKRKKSKVIKFFKCFAYALKKEQQKATLI